MTTSINHIITSNNITNSNSMGTKQFELNLSKEDFKFSAAHFVSHGVSYQESPSDVPIRYKIKQES